MKNKGINLTSVDTPIGGVSWEITPSTAIEIKRIILLLSSKRILVAPIVDSFNRWESKHIEIEKSQIMYLDLYWKLKNI